MHFTKQVCSKGSLRVQCQLQILVLKEKLINSRLLSLLNKATVLLGGKQVINVVRQFILDDNQLMEYMNIFDSEISRGLNKETCDSASIKSIITHVNKLPSGKEEGQFLGLDFSGPTIKVMLVKLENRECTITQKFYDIPEKYMTGKSSKLFDFIAKSMVDFLKGLKLIMRRIPLGVTFGFPIEQSSLQDCKLLRWTKGFACDDLFNKNVYLCLKNSIRKFPELKKIYVIGILNDSVSAVLSLAWQDPSCMIGLVVGSGAEMCYAEKVYRVNKYEAENYGIRDIYINLESAALGEDGCLDKFRTRFDKKMDDNTPNQGKIISDKMVSSEYFGELVRLIIIECLENKLILKGKMPGKIAVKNFITLSHLKQIELDPDDNHDNCRKILKEWGFREVTDEDCFQVQFICRCVSRRSANLVAAQLATIITRIKSPTVTIAADGDSIKNYPNYKWYMTRKLNQLLNPSCSIKNTEEKGLGPAVMAAVFGEEVMNREEKFRRLPGYPMDKCHFGKAGKCLNPDCRARQKCDSAPAHPLIKSMLANPEDLYPTDSEPKTTPITKNDCFAGKFDAVNADATKNDKFKFQKCCPQEKEQKKQRTCGGCIGYNKM